MIQSTAINILALIFILIVLIKFIFILYFPRKKIKINKRIIQNKKLIELILLLLILLVFNYLRKELYIKEILAASLFIFLLTSLGLINYIEDLKKIFEKELKQKKLLKQNWISIIIWLILIIIGIKEIFF